MIGKEDHFQEEKHSALIGQITLKNNKIIQFDEYIDEYFNLSHIRSLSDLTDQFKLKENDLKTEGKYQVKINRTKKLQFVEINVKIINMEEFSITTLTLIETSDFLDFDNKLKELQGYEALIDSVSKSFLNPDPSSLEIDIGYAIASIGEVTDVDRIYVYLKNEKNPNEFLLTNGFVKQESFSIPSEFHVLNKNKFHWFETQLKDNILISDDIESLPPEAQEGTRILHLLGTKSIILILLVYNQNILGFIGFDHVEHKRTFPSNMRSSLNIISEILVSAIVRNRVSRELKQSENRYKNLVDHSPFGIGIIQDEKIKYINNTGLEIIGATYFEEVSDISIYKFIETDQQDILKERINRIDQQNVLEPINYNFIRLNGEIIIIESQAVPILFQGKSASQVIFREVTDLRLTQKSLEASEEKYRTLFETSLDPIFITNAQGRFLDANSAFCELLGYTKKELLNLNTKEIYYDIEDRILYMDILKTYGSVKNYELKLRGKDGKPLYILSSVFVRTNEKGEILQYEGVYKNITEEKLIQEQLLKSEKLKSIGMMAGGIAHDFNNILTSIMGTASLISNQIDDENLVKLIKNIEESSFNASNLTQQLLNYAGQGKLEPETLNLGQELEKLQSFIKVTIPSGIKIIYDIKETGDLFFDKSYLSQIVLILLSNSYEAITGESGRISIVTGSIDHKSLDPSYFDYFAGVPHPKADYSYLEIQDNGTGISGKMIANIFDKYYSSKFQGQGMGLSNARSLLEQYDGLIAVNSKINYGTTVYIFFPVVQHMDPIELKKRTSTKSKIIYDKRVAICDDGENVRNITKQMLEFLNCEVELTSSGLELLRKLEGGEIFDLILIDLSMPKVDGIETIRRIRSRKVNTPIILTSGYSEGGFLNKLNKYDVHDFLQKPYNLDDLKKVIYKVLS